MMKYLLISFIACQTVSAQDISIFTGTWVMEIDSVQIVERWDRRGDSLLSGEGFRVKGDDTLRLESLRLHFDNGRWVYSPTVFSQNNGAEIHFQLSKSDSSRFVFRNPGHDFPQEIIYDFKSRDELEATVKGVVNGSDRSSVFYFKRF